MSKHNVDGRKKKLLKALENNLGLITQACIEAGVKRERYYHYYNNDPEFKRQVDEIVEIQGDFVEGQFFNKIREGSEKSILFYLRYRGRSRGYTDAIDITSGGEKIVSEIKLIEIKGKSDNEGENSGT
jgi:hypothetical protein